MLNFSSLICFSRLFQKDYKITAIVVKYIHTILTPIQHKYLLFMITKKTLPKINISFLHMFNDITTQSWNFPYPTTYSFVILKCDKNQNIKQ